MVDIETVSIVLASAGVIIGIAYYAIELRHQNRTRDTDLVTDLFAVQNSREFQEAYRQVMNLDFADYSDFIRRNGTWFSNTPSLVSLSMVLGFYEQLGLLYHKKLIDIKLVTELFSIRRPWEKVRPLIVGLRKDFKQQDLYEWFEYLYKEVQKRSLDQ
jgi:hypothetical protein